MDVRVEARPLTAGAVSVDSKVTVVALSGVIISAPVISRFSLTPVISVGGTSISSITPTKSLIGVTA